MVSWQNGEVQKVVISENLYHMGELLLKMVAMYWSQALWGRQIKIQVLAIKKKKINFQYFFYME